MKNNITKLKIFLLLLTIIGISSGCNENQNQMGYDNKDLSMSQVDTTSKTIDQSIANQAKEKMITNDEITDVMDVNTDKELLVAIKVENFNRFRLKSIEKTVKSDLEKMYPNHKVVVSTDKKMFWELEKIEQRLQKNNTNKKRLKKDLQKLESLIKEQT